MNPTPWANTSEIQQNRLLDILPKRKEPHGAKPFSSDEECLKLDTEPMLHEL